MVQNPDVDKPLSYLVHYLGYAWVSGKNSNTVSENLRPDFAGNGTYTINGDTNGSCSGYRCDERIEMKLSDIRFTVDPDTLKQSDIQSTLGNIIKVLPRTLTNYSDVEQQLRLTYYFTRTNEWSKQIITRLVKH